MEPISRLEELKRKLAEQNQLRAKPFHLKYLLILYETSNPDDTYIGYMEGFRLLAEWLSPIDIPEGFTNIPKVHNTYVMQQMASILGTYPGTIYHCTLSQIHYQPIQEQETKS